jgi:hypothetical protein
VERGRLRRSDTNAAQAQHGSWCASFLSLTRSRLLFPICLIIEHLQTMEATLLRHEPPSEPPCRRTSFLPPRYEPTLGLHNCEGLTIGSRFSVPSCGSRSRWPGPHAQVPLQASVSLRSRCCTVCSSLCLLFSHCAAVMQASMRCTRLSPLQLAVVAATVTWQDPRLALAKHPQLPVTHPSAGRRWRRSGPCPVLPRRLQKGTSSLSPSLA